MRILILSGLLLLQGCALCERHERGCEIAGTVAVGAAIVVAGYHSGHGGCIYGCSKRPTRAPLP